jgi:hypothetical protein
MCFVSKLNCAIFENSKNSRTLKNTNSSVSFNKKNNPAERGKLPPDTGLTIRRLPEPAEEPAVFLLFCGQLL